MRGEAGKDPKTAHTYFPDCVISQQRHHHLLMIKINNTARIITLSVPLVFGNQEIWSVKIAVLNLLQWITLFPSLQMCAPLGDVKEI